MRKNYKISRESAKQRIDKFLSKELFLYTRGKIIRNINEGNILVNDKKVKPGYRLRENDNIKINIPDKKSKLMPNQKLEVTVLYEDKDIIAIDKPAGMKVHPSDFSEEDTLVNVLISKFPEIENINDGSAGSILRPGIVHRLDRDTSGIMIVARNQESFNGLKRLFKERAVEKKYVALVHGNLENDRGVIKKPIAKASDYKKQVIAGKKTKTKIHSAITEYRVLKKFENCSLVEVIPKTGRTHQIRIHFFSIGNPIVGDDKYKLKKFAKSGGAKRQLLHAGHIEFRLGSKKYSFEAELPEDFAGYVRSL